ncbi:SMI1/KNR4 family protein [Pseudenhygromyxa sp. WMMC2535]|uniref:SMI1/KNR4 family protein n=1 Tax=Pseudenhygromyxa sp. WMMC2535 TaxID=2712867 RepID=UPI00159504E8|nr:SMI1/KNR4 family protein [Pseudenhygromyxa sp. WMMC2535]NVB38659.1 SMI1/KNR4 family protein [Pseudenhygromyxa sp. WMMC2535]
MLTAKDWQHIINFIDERAPGFGARIRGASSERIAELQAIHLAKLPQAYVDFLSLMGENHGGFELSWERYSTISELIFNSTSPRGWRPDHPEPRFVWIAGQKNEEDESYWGDLYLDLELGAREDPPVVARDFSEQDPALLDPEVVFALSFTDFVQSTAYSDYEQVKNMYQYELPLSFSKKKHELTWFNLRASLRALGWRECLPGSENTWFGEHDDPISLDAESTRLGMIRLLIGANDRKLVLSMAEEIKDDFPTIASPGEWFIDRDEDEWTT